ncbi:hypothetical protein [Spongorhabdus nitratireducens]
MRIAFFCLFVVFTITVRADNVLFESETTPLQHDLEQLTPVTGSELVIKGINSYSKPVIFIVRIDNDASKNYRTRVNQEFTIQPGEFNVQLPLSSLKMSGGGFLEAPYSQLHIFAADPKAPLELHQASITTPVPIPDNTLALDFGPEGSPVFPGFRPILPDSPMITGSLKGLIRTSGDALIKDGIKGITRFRTSWPNGQWLLTLWTQDQGEWEYLPHSRSRKITVNDNPVVNHQLTPQQWVDQVWFAGKKLEGGIDGDAWETIGKRRDGKIQMPVTITRGDIDIQLMGDAEGRYLAALVLEPINNSYADSIQQDRKQRFLAQWPVVSSQPFERNNEQAITLTDISNQSFIQEESRRIYSVARDTRLNLVFEISSNTSDKHPVVAVGTPRHSSGSSLQTDIRYGFWRFERPQPNATQLILDDSYLRADLESMRLDKSTPRRIYLQLDIDDEAEPGRYDGSLQLVTNGKLIQQPFSIDVLPVKLPELKYASGLYLEPAPWYHWFPALSLQIPSSTQCDLEFMQNLGFTTVAPALATPDSALNNQLFVQQLNQIEKAGFNPQVLAYTPLKRLVHNRPDAEITSALRVLKLQLESAGLPAPYWSLFDEPRGEKKLQQIHQLAKLLRPQPLGLKMAGHLNHTEHHKLLSTVDLTIANHAYGISKKEITRIKKKSKFWMYNMPRPRLAAGFFLWRSGADGYIQWHARMPTADPLDPTDGREGDVIYMYPWSGSSCPQVMDIHKRLLVLHESTLDLRWLQWLDQQAKTSSKASKLRKDIEEQIPTKWSAANKRLKEEQLIEMRHRIIQFARTR